MPLKHFPLPAAALALTMAFCAPGAAAPEAAGAGSHFRDSGGPPVVGRPFGELSGATADGRSLRLSDYRGRVVLVDFWATWCGPCKAELPNILRIYEQYREQGFEVVGVSLDENAGDVLGYSVAGRPLPWPSIFDGKGWDSPLVKQFGIQGIPAAFLLDREGRVTAVGAKGQKLAALVDKALRTPPPSQPPPRSTPLPSGPPRPSTSTSVASTGFNPAIPAKGGGARIDSARLAQGITRLAAAKATGHTQSDARISAAVAADPFGAARAVWNLLDRPSPDHHLATVSRQVLTPVLGPPDHVQVLDTAAWAAYAAGDAADACRLQARALQAAAAHPASLGPQRELEAGLHARAALYELATGQGEQARTRYAALRNRLTATPPPVMRPGDTKYLELLVSKLQEAGKVAASDPGVAETSHATAGRP